MSTPNDNELATRYGLLTVPDAERDLIGQFLARYGEWAWLEALFAASVIPEGACILDVGAFAGTFGLGISLVRTLKFAGFVEANPDLEPILRRNLSANIRCPWDLTNAMVAGPEASAGIVRQQPGNLGGTSFSKSANQAVTDSTRATTLKALREQYGPFDFVKLDVEGMELDALRGDAAFLETGQTTLWIEANENPSTLTIAGLLLSWNLPLFYFAFPSFNPKNFNGAQEPIFPFAFEAGLLAAPKSLPELSPELREAGCILRPVPSVHELKAALWRTPRWGQAEWAEANSTIEMAALVGHSILGQSFKEFLSTTAAEKKVTLWQHFDEQKAALQDLNAQLAEAEARAAAGLEELQAEQRRHAGAEEDLRISIAQAKDSLQRSEEERAQLNAKLHSVSSLASNHLEELQAEQRRHAETAEARRQTVAEATENLRNPAAAYEQMAAEQERYSALQRKMDETSALVDQQLERLVAAQQTLSTIQSSTTWRVTRPLRAFIGERPVLHAFLRKTKRAVGPFVRRIKGRPSSAQAAFIALPAAPKLVEASAGIDSSHREVARPYFDAFRYLAENPDVAEAGIDPLDHFLLQGWKEGRSPNSTFDTAYYLESNGDVADSGINPLLHYVWVGRAEGRLPQRVLEIERQTLEAAIPPRTPARTADWASAADESPPLSLAAVTAALATDGFEGMVVSVSHDDYAAHCGGVQNVIADEQRAFAAAGWRYLHLSPAAPLPILADRTAGLDYRLRLRLDGTAIGVARFDDLAAALASSRAGGAKCVFVFHHLLGHIPELLSTLSMASGGSAIAWVHDYFSLCPNPTLMRNDVKFCGAPPQSSPGCSVCSFGGERRDHADRMRVFFEAVKPFMLAPSTVALDFWRRTALPHIGARVVAPARLTPGRDVVVAADDAPLRIGYLGSTSFHKGWHVFQRLTYAHANDTRYEFVHLGLGSVPSQHYACDPVRVTGQRRDAMIDAIVRNRIDVAIIWSLWPETFCFTAHEALAGGAFVVARREAGNVWLAVESNAPHQGCAVDDEDSLFRLFETGEIRTLAARSTRRRFELTLGGNTAEVMRSEGSLIPVVEEVRS